MIIDGADFDDNLSATEARENLWRSVLVNAIEEAIFGISRSNYSNPKTRVTHIIEARAYVTVPNRDFDMVCSLAGLDPDAVRERVAQQLATAASPEELLNSASRKPSARPRRKSGPKPRPDAQRFEHDGKNLTIAEWAALSGMRASAIRQRLNTGWHISRAIEKVDGRTTRIRISGKRPARRRGAPFNFGRSKGTGAGSTAQESTNITFSGNEA